MTASITRLARQSFNGAHRHLLAKPAEQLLSSTLTLKARRLIYSPGAPRILSDGLNTYRAPTIKPVKGEYSHLQGLLDQLFPVPEEQAHILDVLAYHAKHPGKKIKHVLLIRGPQGSGKNTFAVTILRELFGTSNVKVHLSDVLTSPFNSDLLDCQILVLDEVIVRDGWGPLNQLKPIITEEVQLGNAKFRDRALGLTPRLFIIVSNDQTPIPLDDDDRRYFVPEYGPPKRNPEFYAALNEALKAEASAFLWALLHRDLGGFDPNGSPPETAAKVELKRAVRPPIERQLHAWLEDRAGPMVRDIVLPEAISRQLRIEGYSPANTERVSRALSAIGAKSLGQLPVRPQWSGRPRCWVVRNIERWSDATSTEWAKHMIEGVGLT